MQDELQRARLRQVERDVYMQGWDFSFLQGMHEEEPLPWDYGAMIAHYLAPTNKLLDMQTGGGEFLLSLRHPYTQTAATEGYAPNVALCEQRLLPLGIDFRQATAQTLPFEDEAFHVVINRHGSFQLDEIARVLKPNGLFITQQVGAENNRDFVDLLYANRPSKPFPLHTLQHVSAGAIRAGLTIRQSGEAFPQSRFLSVEALVAYARIIEWEFPHFSVDEHWAGIQRAAEQLQRYGAITGRAHRFFIVAQK